MLTDLSQKQQNGDIYYLMSKVFELTEDSTSRQDCLELALDNQETLTFSIKAVKEEYKELKKNQN